jgi:hypothetical protein
MISRLLLLVAVLLMPFGMTAATAAVEHHAASMPMQHCPDPTPNHDSKGAFVECTMACSGALPAVDRSSERPLVVEAEPAQPAAMKPLHGLHPETATPPPKFS